MTNMDKEGYQIPKNSYKKPITKSMRWIQEAQNHLAMIATTEEIDHQKAAKEISMSSVDHKRWTTNQIPERDVNFLLP